MKKSLFITKITIKRKKKTTNYGFLLIELMIGLTVFTVSILIIGSSMQSVYAYKKWAHDRQEQFADSIDRSEMYGRVGNSYTNQEQILAAVIVENGPVDFKVPPLIFHKVGIFFNVPLKKV